MRSVRDLEEQQERDYVLAAYQATEAIGGSTEAISRLSDLVQRISRAARKQADSNWAVANGAVRRHDVPQTWILEREVTGERLTR